MGESWASRVWDVAQNYVKLFSIGKAPKRWKTILCSHKFQKVFSQLTSTTATDTYVAPCPKPTTITIIATILITYQYYHNYCIIITAIMISTSSLIIIERGTAIQEFGQRMIDPL